MFGGALCQQPNDLGMNAPAIRGTECFALRHNQSMCRLFAVLLLLAPQCTGQSYDRLAGTAKLWNYVKYFHPRVTAGEIDWDAALMRATPKVLAATDNAAFMAALDEMLGTLKDPATHIADGETGTAM